MAMNGAPVSGTGVVTTTGSSFKFPGAGPQPVFPQYKAMYRTTIGSFTGEGPYLYSYTYAALKNDVGSFGLGKGFFSAAAAPTMLTFKAANKVGMVYNATVSVTRGENRFGGVMRLLGSYTTKVCYFYGGGCALGYNDWVYDAIGDAGFKKGGVVTASYTTNFSFTYYNTALETNAKYRIVAQRFPWTTGTVTVNATLRGQHQTWEQR